MPYNIHMICGIMQISICSILMIFCGLFILAIGIELQHDIMSWSGGISMLFGIIIALVMMCKYVITHKKELYEQQRAMEEPIDVIVHVNNIPQQLRIINPIVVVVYANHNIVTNCVPGSNCILFFILTDLTNHHMGYNFSPIDNE